MSILYPEYQGEPNSWGQVKLPPIEEKFLNRLAKVGSVAGMPRFRIVDGTKALIRYEGDQELPAGDYLAYTAMVNVARSEGYMYADGEGWTKVARHAEVPDGKLAIPATTYSDFGIPRYMVEVYRDNREPGIAESGYVWAWTVDVKERTEMGQFPIEISRYRHPSDFDIEMAQELLRIIESATKETIRARAEKFVEAREKRSAEVKQIRQEEQAEAVERLVRDEL